MFVKNKGIDITRSIGGVENVAAAWELFENCLDKIQLDRLKTFQHADVLLKIANAIAMCRPERIFINTGSGADKQFVRDLALSQKEEAKLSMPGHTIHYDLKEEQGRIIDRTFYIANDDEKINSLANRISREKGLEEVRNGMQGIMRGKTMVIGFYLRGPLGAPVSNPALEITSSGYVAHSAEILYRNIYADFEGEVERLEHFYTNIHSEGLNRSEDLPHARVLMDRSHRTTYSIKCTYAGNTLLLKKGNHRFSVDKAVNENRGLELSEHMFITGIQGPDNRVTWCTGAAPSGCGKTTTAMAGNFFVGDDLAQMWIDVDGTIRSVNPECGIFGIVEDVNQEGDPMLMACLRQPGSEVIWSNVLIDDKGVPHWVGNGETPPQKGENFQGEWCQGKADENGKPVPMSHPNSRCTIASTALANYSEKAEDARGVETRIITYSGRDSDTMPPVRVARNSDEGVVIGATIVSAATATEVGATGVRRQPWANAPFIPGPLADYMQAQFEFFGSDKIAPDKHPVMAGLNYFLTDEARGGSSKKLLGEKKDVKAWLGWLERLAHGDAKVLDTPIGGLPLYADLKTLFDTMIEKTYPRELYDKQFSLYIDKILSRIDLQLEAYGKNPDTPGKLFEILNAQRQALLKLQEAYGSIVTPDQIEAYNHS
jgi:phosphoenolpyruvate carboxykinase (GTP)